MSDREFQNTPRTPKKFYRLWAQTLHRFGFQIALLLCILSGILGWNVYQHIEQDGIPLDFTPQSIFLDDGEMVQHLRAVEQTFGREDNDFLILVQGAALTTTEGKHWLQETHQSLENIHGVTQVLSLVNTPYIKSIDGLLSIETTWEQSEPWTAIQSQPIFRNLLSTDDGHIQIIQVRVEQHREKIADLEPVSKDITAQIQNHPPPEGVDWQLTGVPHIRTEIVDLMLKDELFYIPVSAVMFFITIVWLFKGVRLALAPVLAVQIAMGWSIGLLIVSNVTFNILSMLVPAIAMVIGIADGIHLVSRYREERGLSSDPIQVMALTLEEMASACFLTTITTAGGFASLLVADTVVIQDFGWHASVAVIVTYIGIMVIIPLWLRFIPTSVFEHNLQSQPQWTGFFEWIHRINIERRFWIIGISALLCAVVGWIASGVTANSYILEVYDPEHPTVEAMETMENNLSGIVPVFIHLESTTSLYTVEGLQAIDTLEEYLKTQGFIRWNTSIASQQRLIHNALTEIDGLPSTEDFLAQERLLLDLGGGLNNGHILSEDETQARILLLCKDIGGIEFLEFKEQFDAFATQQLQDSDIQFRITGDGMLASIGIDKLIGDLMSSVGLVFAIILVVLALLMRNVAHTMLAFIPNVLPLLTTLAFLELTGRDLQVSNIVSFTVAIGLAVDDTIHFVARYRSERNLGYEHAIAMERTLKGAGHAIILTSILLICGFGLLATSELSSTYYFGMLTSITLVSAIIADLFLLPAMLNSWELRDSKSEITDNS